jgi:thiamine biosynthesis lipoprotein
MAVASREHHELRVRAMGTDAHIMVVRGPVELCARAAERLAHLERAWSRFRPDSEVSRLNAAHGRPVVVSPITYSLIARAVHAWRCSGGAFDPTVLPNLVAHGYDRDFAAMASDAPTVASSTETTRLPPGAGVVELDPVVGAVRLPDGVALDLGGIAKGFAADMVADELRDAGADGVCVNLGGDLRVRGTPPWDRAWAVEIEREPGVGGAPARAPGTVVLRDGGIATSSCRRRVWRRDGEERHHVIDPRSGRSAIVAWSSVTAIACRAVDAEPAATAALLCPDAPAATAALAAFGAVGVAVDQTGRLHELGPVAELLAGAA